jgi:hypothetical protein
MTMKTLLLGVAVAALALPAHATVVIDRDYTALPSDGSISFVPIYLTPSWEGPNGFVSNVFYQSFTVGVAGTFAGVKIEGPSSTPWFPTASPVEVQLLSGSVQDLGGFHSLPTDVLATSWIQPSDMPGNPYQGAYADFLSQGIAVTEGEALTFAFASVSSNEIMQNPWFAYPGTSNAMTGGYSYPGTALMATYVDTGASLTGSVPEPSTWAMMLTGFAALAYATFRRAKRPRLA